jgi:hypothetical protein
VSATHAILQKYRLPLSLPSFAFLFLFYFLLSSYFPLLVFLLLFGCNLFAARINVPFHSELLLNIARCFFTTHALDYVSHTRQSQANVLCAFYADGPLPCPRDVWEAPNAEVWASRYRAWQERSGAWIPCSDGTPPLQPRDMFYWVHGRTTGREDKLLAWFQIAEQDLARLVFECSRAQAWTEAAEAMMVSGGVGLAGLGF